MMPDHLPSKIHWPHLRLLAEQQTLPEHRTQVKTGDRLAYALKVGSAMLSLLAVQERREGGAERCEHNAPPATP